MENSLSALTYKGSIPHAILESQKQKKLFVVYLSGEDSDSTELEKSTWTDLQVAQTVSKYCILLHIVEGSADASNFSAIYPQKSVPAITAIGYNGVQVWQSEGFVTAEVLASCLEKAWLGLHLQETTATVLSAALASKKHELSNPGSSDNGLSVEGSSLGTVVPSPSVENHVGSTESDKLVASEKKEEKTSHRFTIEGKSTKVDNHESSKSSKSSNSDESLNVVSEQSTSPAEEAKELSNPSMQDLDSSGDAAMSSSHQDAPPPQKRNNNHQSDVPSKDSLLDTTTTKVAKQDEVCVNDREVDISDNNNRVKESSDVHLNIRLPSGVSLQDKFSLTSSLRMVKDYVDKNQDSGIGSYDLAIPYPRKVFTNEDLSKSLSELSLFNRQALIVVPHQRATSYNSGGSSSNQTNSDSSAADNGGYFAFVKRMLSYINPLSYLGGSTNSSGSGQAQSGMWEYSPNPALQNNLARPERPFTGASPNQSTSAAGRNDSRSRQTTTSHFGSNIHTLKHDEDDSRFGDRNPFWNGNSTQYGGNSDGK